MRPELGWYEAVLKNRRHIVVRNGGCRVRSSRGVPLVIPRVLRSTESESKLGYPYGPHPPFDPVAWLSPYPCY